MIQITNISLIPSDNKPVINVSQFDNISRVLRFNVFDDAEMEVPHVFDNTETVLLNIRKNDNNIVVITGVIVSDIDPETQEALDQYLTFELTEQACACVGSNYGEVSITRGSDEVIGSCNFRLLVERSPLAGGVSSQSAIDNLTTQIEQITEEVIGDNYYDKTEVDNLLDGKADVSDLPDMTNYYDKTEVDNLLDGKADVSDLPDMTNYYDKTEVDNLLDGKADVSDLPDMTNYYDKTEVDNLLDGKADVSDLPDMSDYYTKTEIDNKIYDILPVGSASGSIASFNTALANPLVSCDVDENATKLYQFGANLFDDNTIIPYNTNVTVSKNGNVVTITNNNTYTINALYGTTMLFKKGTYTFSIASALSEPISLYNVNNVWYSTVIPRGSLNGTVVIDSDVELVVTSYLSSNNSISIDSLQIQLGSIVTPYDVFDKTVYNLPLSSMPVSRVGYNTFYADVGDISLTYKDTIQNYIDTRVNAVSNRSLSMMRTLETLEKSVTLDKSSELERGDNNDDNAR